MSSMLLIKCPITFQHVATGILTDEASLQGLRCESAEFKWQGQSQLNTRFGVNVCREVKP
jgi:hypothetical protein